MSRLLKSIFLVSFFLFFYLISVSAEEITITTYYPSPYGSYNQLGTNSLGVGDNNGNGSLDSGDAPDPTTNPGEVWIDGKVNIGNGIVPPTEVLEVNGNVRATGFRVTAAAAFSGTMNVIAGCSITVVGGIITASTC